MNNFYIIKTKSQQFLIDTSLLIHKNKFYELIGKLKDLNNEKISLYYDNNETSTHESSQVILKNIEEHKIQIISELLEISTSQKLNNPIFIDTY